jgi:uncharacterized protein (TIGR03437 family)
MRFRASWTGEGIDGFMLPSPIGNAIPLFRLLFCPGGAGCSPPIHHWTADAHEHTVLQPAWRSEGIAGYVFPATGAIVTQSLREGSKPSGPVLEAVVHPAIRQTRSVAPGQLVAIYGSGFGSQPTVLFDDTPAKLWSLSGHQILAIVPWIVDGKNRTRISIVDGEKHSASMDLEVAQSSPGIFARGEFSSGESLARLEAGRLLTVYFTGRGDPNLPVSLMIGGYPAEIVSLQSVGDQTGVWALQAQVPDEMLGGAVPISMQIGEAFSQPGMIVTLRNSAEQENQ